MRRSHSVLPNTPPHRQALTLQAYVEYNAYIGAQSAISLCSRTDRGCPSMAVLVSPLDTWVKGPRANVAHSYSHTATQLSAGVAAVSDPMRGTDYFLSAVALPIRASPRPNIVSRWEPRRELQSQIWAQRRSSTISQQLSRRTAGAYLERI